MKHFDLIVLGSGVAGSTVAEKCRAAGWNVAIVDAGPYGGTCALRGCDAKKVLLGAAEAVDAVRRLAGKGVEGEVRIDWPTLMQFKRTFTEPIPDSREQQLANAGISTFHGTARFVGPTVLEIGGERMQADRIHIATGAKPTDLSIRGAEHLTDSEHFLDLDELPERIVFLGGGYVAFELAHICASAGAKVIMVEALDRPLMGFDPDLVELLVERTRDMGIDLQLSTRVEAVETQGSGFAVQASSDAGSVTFEADMVVHSAGRIPDLAGLDLDKAGVDHDRGGIVVNEYMQSVSNPAIYAAGDVAKGAPQLTPVASFEAHVAASNLLEGNHRRNEYPPIPSVVFTLPPLARVGVQEDEAREKGLDFEIHHELTSSWYSSKRVGEPLSGYKLLVEQDTGRILGAHLLGPRADELINLFAMAMHAGITSREIKRIIFAYPTLASDMRYML
jgi:glutathione reductase (NADPH)